MKRRIMFLLVVFLSAVLLLSTVAEDYLDNSALLPPYRPDSKVTLLEDGTPDWLAECIFAEARIETCKGDGGYDATFTDAETHIIDHLAEVGVNCVWLTPIAERSAQGWGYSGYANYGPHTVARSISGEVTDEGGRAALKRFVDYAHSKNVRLLLDIETWGVAPSAPLVTERPELFNGVSHWGGPAFDWSRTATVDWMVDTLVQLALDTGVDGFRCDCEPAVSGYAVYGKVKSRLLEKGRKIVCLSEHESTRTHGGTPVYDLAEWGVNASDGAGGMTVNDGINDIFYRKNIVDVVKDGTDLGSPEMWRQGVHFRYYTMMLSCHDNLAPLLKGRTVDAGYCAIFAPFLPLWRMGEEWNDIKEPGMDAAMYFSPPHWGKLNTNRAFYETFKRYIRIRRQYPGIFQYFPADITDANICKVPTKNGDKQLGAYARFADEKAILIIPNTDDAFALHPTVTIPYGEAGLTPGEYIVTDLLTGKKIAEGHSEKLLTFKTEIATETCGVYLVEPKNAAAPTTTKVADPTVPVTGEPAGEPTEPVDTEEPVETTEQADTEEPIETTEPADTEEPTETTEPVDTEEPAIDDQPFPWVWVAVGGGAVIAVVVILLILLKKKR